jgi:nitrogen regulatory protein P-II 1
MKTPFVYSVKKIEAIIKPFKLETLMAGLDELGITGMTVSEIKVFDNQMGRIQTFRGLEYRIDFIRKIKVMIVVTSDQVDLIVRKIIDSCRTGSIGDGEIFVSPLDRIYRIRTGEVGRKAL